MSGTQQSSGFAGVEDTLKDLWGSRPARPRGQRKIAGVASGIALRYGLDPVVVRVALVVATVFGGAGVLLYLLGWLLLPEQGERTSPLEALAGKGRSSTSRGLTLCLCIALFPAASWALSGPLDGGIPGLLLGLGALFLLHRSRGHLRRPTIVQEDTMHASYPAAGESAGTSTTPDPETGWDPLGAAPLAWDLPEPSPPAEQEPQPPRRGRRRSKVGTATLGLALLTAAAGVVLEHTSADPWFNTAHTMGLTLAVLGTGMVVGAFLGGGRWLIALAAPLAVAALVATHAPTGSLGSVGGFTAAPTTLDEVQPRYDRSMGDVNLDLRSLPEKGSITTGVQLGMGTARVIVPNTADVRVKCTTDMGSTRCLGQSYDGMGGERRVTDNGPDGKGGLQITLDAKVGMGDLEVRRG